MMNTLRDNAPKTAIERRIQDIAEAVKAGKMSREQGAQAIEHTKRAMEAENKRRDHNQQSDPLMRRTRKIHESGEERTMSREQRARTAKDAKARGG